MVDRVRDREARRGFDAGRGAGLRRGAPPLVRSAGSVGRSGGGRRAGGANRPRGRRRRERADLPEPCRNVRARNPAVRSEAATLEEISAERWSGPCPVVGGPGLVRRVGTDRLGTAGIPTGTRGGSWRRRSPGLRGGCERSSAVASRCRRVRTRLRAGPESGGSRTFCALHPARGRGGDRNDGEGLGTHRALLGNGVLVSEGRDLRRVEPEPYRVVCLALRLAAGDGVPARVLPVRNA